MHEETRLIDWIWAIHCVVVVNGQPGCALGRQRSANWIAERQIYSSGAIDKRIVDDEHGETLAGFARGEAEYAKSCCVVFPLLRRSIAGAKTYSSDSARAAYSRDSYIHLLVAFVHYI